jgi:hypothetical protein
MTVMPQYIPNELALVRSTIHQADELVELLSDEDTDQSQLLNQIHSILEQNQAGVDLLIELRNKLEANSVFYNERAKAYREFSTQMAGALSFVNESILELYEVSAESLCIQNNPVKAQPLFDISDSEEMERLCAEYPHIFKKKVIVEYSYDSAYVKANQDKPEVHKYFNFTQGKHIRVRRSQNPKSLPKG